ncbi:hypothetical protein L596_001006 [Steinernema carpocapsae]|uniref:Uncharacterized protein n=1 Tax=Steinernema carpocapsae TaxID=34508 RepID=A0A4U8UKC3_STECR|nr:hypothetical protein L596_001006 [Steinernema carpocapsae]
MTPWTYRIPFFSFPEILRIWLSLFLPVSWQTPGTLPGASMPRNGFILGSFPCWKSTGRVLWMSIHLRRVTSARQDMRQMENWLGRALGLFKSFPLDGDKNEGEEGFDPGSCRSWLSFFCILWSNPLHFQDCGQEKPHPFRTPSLKECSSAVSYGIAYYNACYSLAEMSAAFQPLVFRG